MAGRLLAGSNSEINTIKDLVNSGKPLAGTKTHKQLFFDAQNASDDDRESDSVFKEICDKFIILDQDDYVKTLQDLIDGVNKSYALVGVLNVSSIVTKFDPLIVHKVPETLASLPVSFATWRGLPYLTRVDEKLQQLVQGGIVSHIGTTISSKHRFLKAKEQEDASLEQNFLRMNDIAPGFYLLLAGCISGMLLLFVGGLISPLQNTVWMAVGGVLLFSVFLRLTLFRKISFLEILAVVIGVAWNKQPIRLSYRIKFMSWIIFGYILCQFYLATMAGNLMSRPVEKMDTFEDLVMSNKMLGGSKLSPTFFKRVQGTSEKFDNLSKLMMKRFITFERDVFRKKLLDLMNGKNKSLALSTLLNTTSASHNYDTSIVRKLPEVLSSVSLSIAAWRGLPCVSRIEKKLRQLKWAGIASHLGDMEAMKNQIRQETNNDKDQSMENSFIELSDLIPGFLLMMLGYSIGLLCLFCEIIYYKFTGSRKNYRSKRKVRIRKIKY
ncbi:hypothetical protein HCN44_009687 [Aphidius gifuensis]|uniref:Ionotropic receptor n=1 Tax=Aphidius gifuensis TaxID=684658 RepID=A0A834Y6T4_APHGI|nr:hypothetical protein HCN44_009687 [Aphidius gifuensis]